MASAHVTRYVHQSKHTRLGTFLRGKLERVRTAGKRNNEEMERERKRQGLYVVVERVGGGDVTVILATPTHILQPLPQWEKYVFLQHAIMTDYSAAFEASETLGRMKQECCGQYCVLTCKSVYCITCRLLNHKISSVVLTCPKCYLQCYYMLITCLQWFNRDLLQEWW